MEISRKYRHIEVEVLDGYEFLPGNNDKPFSFVPEAFETRKLWKQQGNGAEKVLKLGLNSLYGKLAQQVGFGTNKTPPYYSLFWAGVITSTIRAKLFEAMCANPHAIIYAATDGIASLAPLDVKLGENLGDWEVTEYDGITIAQAGVYWLHKTGEPDIVKYRGFDKDSLTPEKIIEAWKSGDNICRAPSTRFIGMGSALSNNVHTTWWRQWKEIDRELTLYPEGKRSVIEKGEPWHSLVASMPTTPEESALYESYPFAEFNPAILEMIDGVPGTVYHDEEEWGME